MSKCKWWKKVSVLILIVIAGMESPLFKIKAQQLEQAKYGENQQEIEEFQGNKYQLVDKGMAWNDAKKHCESIGGYCGTESFFGPTSFRLIGERENIEAEHFYEDYNHITKADNFTINVFSNGGNVTVPNTLEKKNYKKCVLYTDITASYLYTVNHNGVVKPSTGKVIVGITSTNTKPEIIKGKIIDKEAAKIATASIKSDQITVTAQKQPGIVWLWAIDTGGKKVSASIPVNVKAAPTATNIYAMPDTDASFIYGKTRQYKNEKINIGESVKVYLYPVYKKNKAVMKADMSGYTVSVSKKQAEYFSVKQTDDNPLCFEISAKGLKDKKSVSGKITFQSNLNGRKTTFIATAINQVSDIVAGNESGLTKTSDYSFDILASDIQKVTGTFEMHLSCVSDIDETTDKVKIYSMGDTDGYDALKLAEGKVKIIKKRTAAQKKISMKAEKDNKTITVTVSKGAKPVTAYFLVVYNTKKNGLKKGYAVISVTVK